MTAADLISKPYLLTQVELHAQPRGYGGNGDRWAPTVIHVAKRHGCRSVLDYGCGQGTLGRALRKRSKLDVREYDPAFKALRALPDPADLVVSTDVLEHIEPDKLDAVFDHVRSLTRIAALLVVSIRPANKVLSDGRNAHLIIEPREWWESRVRAAGFTVLGLPDVLPEKGLAKVWASVVTP